MTQTIQLYALRPGDFVVTRGFVQRVRSVRQTPALVWSWVQVTLDPPEVDWAKPGWPNDLMGPCDMHVTVVDH
jgi:hypothetical protein